MVQVQADVREWIKDTDSERAAYEAFLASDARTAPDPATLSRTEDEIAQVGPVRCAARTLASLASSSRVGLGLSFSPSSQMRVEEQQLLGELDRLASEQERLQATVADLEREAADVRALEEQYVLVI